MSPDRPVAGREPPDDPGGSEDRPQILVVDDDEAFRRSTVELLRQDGYEVVPAEGSREAGEALAPGRFDLILLDLRMPGVDGHGFIETLRRRGDRTPILMVSAFGTVSSTVDALHLGADDFLTKPVEPDVLSARVADLLERRPGPARIRSGTFHGMVGRSEPMQQVYRAIRRVAPSDATVLLTGETGTGKELAARAIHELSERRGAPLVPVNCAALAEGVLESELFGHVRGAFTGAVSGKEGLFEAADGGTLLLDEIGDVGLSLQQRLLRAVQEGEVRRVGSVQARPVDVRLIASTARDLRTEVEAGRFREDLFYRLNVFSIQLPPLRERMSDLPLLVEHALDGLRDDERPDLFLSPFAFRLLRAHEWPGNVRELLAVVQSAAIRAEGSRIEAQHLPAELRTGSGEDRPTGRDARYRSQSPPKEERSEIVEALEEAGWSRERTAELLGMSRTTLWRKMKEHGITEG